MTVQKEPTLEMLVDEKNDLRQGFSTFCYPRTPKSTLTLCVPPNQSWLPFAYPQIKNSTQMSFFWVFLFLFCIPPMSFSHPLGVHVPQVENPWFSSYTIRFCTFNILPRPTRVHTQEPRFNILQTYGRKVPNYYVLAKLV